MREILDEGRRNESVQSGIEEIEAKETAGGEAARFPRVAAEPRKPRSSGSVCAFTSTRSDWLLHGRPRADASVASEPVRQVVVERDAAREDAPAPATMDIPDEDFIADTMEGPEVDEEPSDQPATSRAETSGSREEFLTLGELEDDLQFVERAPRTPRAALLDRVGE